MALDDVKQLRTVNSQAQAQRLLNEGWRILAVCVRQDGADQHAEYHLGHTDAPNPLEQMSTAQLEQELEALRSQTPGRSE